MIAVDDGIKIVRFSDIDKKGKVEAIQVFVDSFYDLYTSISKDKQVLIEFFLSSFDPNLAYAAIQDSKAVGFLAIANWKERSLKFNKAKCIALFGRVMGRIICHQMTYLSGKPNLTNETDICIDYLATAAQCRGKGIATKLIEYTCTQLCHGECFIEVAGNNAVAKRLYDHAGFKEYDRQRNLLARILKSGSVIKMKKRVS